MVFHCILMTLVESEGFHTLPSTTSLSTVRRWLVRNTKSDVALTDCSEPNSGLLTFGEHTRT